MRYFSTLGGLCLIAIYGDLSSLDAKGLQKKLLKLIYVALFINVELLNMFRHILRVLDCTCKGLQAWELVSIYSNGMALRLKRSFSDITRTLIVR